MREKFKELATKFGGECHYSGKDRTMYVKKMTEEQATAFHKAWGKVPLPFKVVFQ